jgi:hypothetical protein
MSRHRHLVALSIHLPTHPIDRLYFFVSVVALVFALSVDSRLRSIFATVCDDRPRD